MEETSETSEIRGGKGNAVLMSFDYNKDINVTLTDALFSAKSMALMFGNGTLKPYTGDKAFIMKTETFVASALSSTEALPTAWTTGTTAPAVVSGWNPAYVAPDGKLYKKINPKFYDENGTELTAATWNTNVTAGKTTFFCSYDIKVDGAVIEINADTFPKNYYVVIETYARDYASGKDDFFQLIFPSAKLLSNNTIEMNAGGDASTLSMSLRIQKPASGAAMVSMVKYGLADTGVDPVAENGMGFYHNHVLTTNNESDLA